MAKNARSIALNKAIEDELITMLNQGLTEAPISAKTLHERLKAKGVVKGKLSTLSSPERKEMIACYRAKQVNASDIDETDDIKYGSVKYYKKRNQELRAELNEKNQQLSRNTGILMEVINRVESQSTAKVEELITPLLVKSDALLNLDDELSF